MSILKNHQHKSAKIGMKQCLLDKISINRPNQYKSAKPKIPPKGGLFGFSLAPPARRREGQDRISLFS